MADPTGDSSAIDELAHWREYYAATEVRPPRETLLRALDFVPHSGRAIDLGCGCGHDTLAMLRHGLSVIAVDVQPDAIERTRRQAEQAGLAQGLTALLKPFEEVDFGECHFVNASFSLPFCDLGEFDSLWRRIRGALLPGGVFAGQLFGVNDQWAREPGHHAHVFLTRARVDELTSGLERLHFEEVERDGETATGKPRYWHVFHMVLRQPAN